MQDLIFLLKEIQSVFAVYGIKVDYRHLTLIADYMTFAGKVQAFDRGHMMSCASPFQRISFESACQFLSLATVNGISDQLKSPSACIVTGKHIKSGTGFFDLYVPLKSWNKIFILCIYFLFPVIFHSIISLYGHHFPNLHLPSQLGL